MSVRSEERQEKLPLKSMNGRRCLTKCYPKGEKVVHPVILTGVEHETHSFCAIDPVYSRSIESEKTYDIPGKEFNMIFIDACKLEDNKIYQPPNELESLLLGFYFNANDFLSNMYGLYSFDQVIYWTLDNNYLPFDTIKRVHNCAWKAYGNKIEAITNIVVDYYYDLAKNYWLYDYVKVIRNEYSFNLTTQKKNIPSETEEELYDIILSEFFTYDFFNDTIKRYVYLYQDIWDSIESHYIKLKNFIFRQLIENIEADTSVGNFDETK